MGTWSLAGNALGNPPHGVLETTDSNALVLETSGTERLRIDAAGNVGVNNPSPQGTFDVKSIIQAYHQLSALQQAVNELQAEINSLAVERAKS